MSGSVSSLQYWGTGKSQGAGGGRVCGGGRVHRSCTVDLDSSIRLTNLSSTCLGTLLIWCTPGKVRGRIVFQFDPSLVLGMTTTVALLIVSVKSWQIEYDYQ